MARRGWVSAQTGPEEWHRLQVFDDGWVEVPGFARALSDTRAMNRKKLRAYVLTFGMLALMYVYANLVLSLDDPPEFLTYGGLVLGLAFVGGIGHITYLTFLIGRRNRDQLNQDHRQMQAMKASGRQIRRVPGSPIFRRAATAEQFASWLDGETHVRASDIVDVAASREGDLHVVTVRLSDGRTRDFRSPDGKITELLSGLRPGVRPQ